MILTDDEIIQNYMENFVLLVIEIQCYLMLMNGLV